MSGENRRATGSQHNRICYLCGRSIALRQCDYDHVPPRRYYPRALRVRAEVHLIRLPTHAYCNRAYQLDEEYFFVALVPLAAAFGTATARHALTDLSRALRRSQGLRLLRGVGYEGRSQHELGLEALDGEPDLSTSPNLSATDADAMLARLDRARLERVIWKIVRGLHYREHGRSLDEALAHSTELGLNPDATCSLNLAWRSVPGDVGAFRYCRPEDGAIAGQWWLKFWGHVVATVSCEAPERERSDRPFDSDSGSAF